MNLKSYSHEKTTLNLLFGLLLLSVFATSCNPKKAPSKKEKTTVILVHSAWLGGWQWKETVAHLKHEQLKVIAPDLVGRGSDKAPPNEITMDDYVSQLIELIDAEEKPVVLVGHSFNEITISRVAELRPKKVKKINLSHRFLSP